MFYRFPFLRRILVSILALGGLGITGATERPNILFVYTDDISYRNIGCYPGSYSWVKTPNIDALAASGVRFDRGYVGAWCMPARATTMTGHHQYGNKSLRLMLTKYPGAVYNKNKMPLWPEALRGNGYFTGMIGKWHLGMYDGWGRAWDYQRVWNRSKHTKNASAYYETQKISFNGKMARKVEGYPTDFYTDWAVDFIEGEERDPEKPWFLWLCYGAAHGPFTPAERHRDLFADAYVDPPADIYPPRPGKPLYMQEIDKWTKGEDGRPKLEEFHTPKGGTTGMYGSDISDWNRQYQQTITGVDENLARLMDALEKSGQRKNTLVIFTSDQGFAFGQHGFTTKMAPYDANIRPPMIFSHPGQIPAGTVCKHPVSGPDLVSTILAQTGTEEPWFMHGHDFSPLLANPGRKEWEHGAMLVMTGFMWGRDTRRPPLVVKHTQGIPWWVSYSKGKYKYIRTVEPNEIEELYDLENDPEELTNLVMDSKHHDRVREFREATVAELRRTYAYNLEKFPGVFPLADDMSHAMTEAGSEYRKNPDEKPLAVGALRVLEFMLYRLPPRLFH